MEEPNVGYKRAAEVRLWQIEKLLCFTLLNTCSATAIGDDIQPTPEDSTFVTGDVACTDEALLADSGITVQGEEVDGGMEHYTVHVDSKLLAMIANRSAMLDFAVFTRENEFVLLMSAGPEIDQEFDIAAEYLLRIALAFKEDHGSFVAGKMYLWDHDPRAYGP